MKSLVSTPALRWLRRAGIAMLCLGGMALAQAQNAIQAVTSSVQSGTEVIRVDFSRPLAAPPAGFTVQNPAHIALDFPNTSNVSGRNSVEFNQGNLLSVNMVQAAERTRMVLNLKQAAAYRTSIQGNSLLVVLDPAPGPQLATPPLQSFSEDFNRNSQPLRDIDFRTGPDNTGRVIVELANNQVGVDVRQQGRQLVVEFTRSTLPEGLRRRLDVTDFNTPVQFVNAQQVGDRVRMTIDARGDWEHSAYQSDNQFVVEVRARKVDPTKLTQGAGYTGEKLSLNFQNIDIRSLLQVIADFTNFNIVTS
ncbi:AMIN domain-containing protein, partial [uncultured Variovorax sp.]|uniref:type IV pilus secretin family protein n=1 Tax=uncultured Variovorax sp. TaxID=114708 RepID=UPI0025F6F3A8